MKPAPLAPQLEEDVRGAFAVHGARFGRGFEATVAVALVLPWYLSRTLPSVALAVGLVLGLVALRLGAEPRRQRRRAAVILEALRDRPDLVARIVCGEERIAIRLATGATATMFVPAWRLARVAHELAARCPKARVLGRPVAPARVVR